MPISASSIGMFSSTGAVLKCWSIFRAPASIAQNRSTPMTIASASPTADQIE
jgi:hypothetical protein